MIWLLLWIISLIAIAAVLVGLVLIVIQLVRGLIHWTVRTAREVKDD